MVPRCLCSCPQDSYHPICTQLLPCAVQALLMCTGVYLTVGMTSLPHCWTLLLAVCPTKVSPVCMTAGVSGYVAFRSRCAWDTHALARCEL